MACWQAAKRACLTVQTPFKRQSTTIWDHPNYTLLEKQFISAFWNPPAAKKRKQHGLWCVFDHGATATVLSLTWRQRQGWDLRAQLISLQPAARSIISKLLTHKRRTCVEAAAARHRAVSGCGGMGGGCETLLSDTTFTMMRPRSRAQLFLALLFMPVK